MPFSPRADRRTLLGALAGCGVLAVLVPALAARAPTANIEVRNKGKFYRNFNAGTEVWEQDVTLSQAPDTLIRADRAEGRNLADGYDDGHWTLTGKVHIEFDGAVLDADSATVEFVDGGIGSILVNGRPAVFSHPVGDTGQRNEGRSETITYDGARRQVRFVGDATYSFGPYTGTAGGPLVYNLDSTEVATEAGPGSRIIFTFRNMQASARIWRANINAGTQMLEQDVELRRAPDTLLRADRAEGTDLTDGYDDGHWTLTRNVRIEHDRAELDADAATVAFAGGVIQSMEVHGNPARFSYPTRVEARRFEGQAESITYDGGQRLVRVIGHPSRYTFGPDQYSSDKPLRYDLDASTVSTEDNGDPDARFRAILQPDRFVPTPRTPPRSTAQ